MNTLNTYEYLITLIKWCQQDPTDCSSRYDILPENHKLIIGGGYYLLQQSVRQIWNKKGHKCVSKEALNLWNKFNINESIFDYYYQKPVHYKNTEPVYIECFKGANSEPDWKGKFHILVKMNF